jgi:hypothetical protein
MKPCFGKRRLVALLALGELDVRRAPALRAHLQTCAGCRAYFEAMSGISQKLAAADSQPELETSAVFHQRLMGRLRSEQAPPAWNSPGAWLAGLRLNWRVALPVASAGALLVLALALFPRHPGTSPSVQVSRPAQALLPPGRSLSPTVANYQQVASRSLDEFDDLLSAQARRNPCPAPSYTASMFAVASAPDWTERRH